MKKSLLLPLLFLALIGTSSAQEGFKLGLGFSPTFNLGSVDTNKVRLSNSSGLGYKYGLLFNFGFTENYAIHSGLHVVTKSVSEKSGSGKFSTILTTVEIPLAFKLRSSELGSGLFLTGFFGASLDVYVGAKGKISGLGALDGKTDINEQVAIMGGSFIVGAGTDLELSFGTVAMGVSYHQGLTNIANKGYKETITIGGSTTTIKPLENTRNRISYIALDLGFYF